MIKNPVLPASSSPRSLFSDNLLELPGIGPWTAQYIAMRALGDPNVRQPDLETILNVKGF